MSISVEEFTGRRIPEIVAESGRGLSALFCTYNSVHGFSSGEVLTGKPGLTIQVYSGGAFPENLALSVVAIKLGLMDLHHAIEAHGCQRSREAQSTTEVAMASALQMAAKGGKMLVVVYAGLRAFNEALIYTSTLRRQVPDATIVVLTCDCDLRRKEEQLKEFVSSGVVSNVVVTPNCGGRGDMGQIVNALITAWPAEDQCKENKS